MILDYVKNVMVDVVMCFGIEIIGFEWIGSLLPNLGVRNAQAVKDSAGGFMGLQGPLAGGPEP